MNRVKSKKIKVKKDAYPLIKKGFTIVEITVVLAVMLTLISVAVYSFGGYREWQKGSEAGVNLRVVYTAQRTYLAEHPTELATDLTEAKLLPYLSGAKVMPIIEDMDGNPLDIDFTVSPPVLKDGEDVYDISPKSDDGLWDVGN